MSDLSQFHDDDNFSFMEQTRPVKLPDMLNVLTILTFIGSAMSLVGSFYSYATVCSTVQKLDEIGERGNIPMMKNMMKDVSAMAIRSCEVKMPILIIGIISAILCIAGAIKMRKFQKQGFYIYTIGEIGLPIAQTILLYSVTGGLSLFFSLLIPVIFIVLYATQLKHLK